ncbi:DUF368 domain-containing protein [Mesobacillus maritimus]|nr:DUF368 domain-containing protein [Mesobacillus maritimus]MCM3587513.1 DUF368 domain-containing protein [Mesobacillus maritimus]MCM3671159.1 DUF368 domain-containing protein [Mesobacillus maritimus]
MFQWKNLFKGMMIGASDVVPGVSGGTIALLVGIYERLIGAINGLTTKDWKRHVIFLIPVGLGMGISILTLSHLFSYLLESFPKPTFFFFLGLVMAIVPLLLREAEYKQNFQASHYVLLVIAAIFVAWTGFMGEPTSAVMTSLSGKDYVFLFFAGWLASSAMILPGISGSLVLLLLGVYETIINAVKTLHFPIILAVGFGVVIGLLLTSKFISYLFKNFRTATYAVVTGFVVGSIFVIFPGLPETFLYTIICLITFVFGFYLAYLLGQAGER